LKNIFVRLIKNRRTQGNFSGLNTVCKKFTEIVTQTRPERGGMSSPLLSPLFSPKATTSLSTQQSGSKKENKRG